VYDWEAMVVEGQPAWYYRLVRAIKPDLFLGACYGNAIFCHLQMFYVYFCLFRHLNPIIAALEHLLILRH
jgi:hypothetical protein